jgi:hypothetical protein
MIRRLSRNKTAITLLTPLICQAFTVELLSSYHSSATGTRIQSGLSLSKTLCIIEGYFNRKKKKPVLFSFTIH